LRHPSFERAPGATVEASADSRPSQGSARVALPDAVLAARAWLAARPRPSSVPTEVLALADLASAAPAAERALLGRLVVDVATALAAPRTAVGTPGSLPRLDDDVSNDSRDARAVGRDGEAARRVHRPSAPSSDTGRDASEPIERSDPAAAAAVSAAAARIAVISSLAEPDSGAVELDTVTSAAGLCLLYPWLADVCRAAMDLQPGLDEVAVRAHALAAIVDPADLGLLADPLVTFLAGGIEPLDAQAALPRADDVRAIAEQALLSFASLLPGFGESSPEFIRSEWILRAGLLDRDLDPARLTAATHPLDVVLGRLPYPLALFRLPWSPALMMRFRP
jgi:hypothetical protein